MDLFESAQNNSPQRDIYTVSRLNREVRAVLEGSFPLLWVEGEISNLARPSSGHIYFSLKDAYSQVRCAMFRMKRQLLRFQPENGMQVVVRARVGLYEGRGEYQLVVEQMEPAGEGALQRAFEALKRKLAAEGLFDTEYKQPLPTFPRCIGVVTSPSGAAIRDVLSVLRRRFPSAPVIVYPVQVQGDQAAPQIRRALEIANRRAECDVLILTRGGGSLEDLQSFNDEGVARTLFASKIPVVTGVGHEVDFTIADFVADLRAPTPSAAAEAVTPDRDEWLQHLRAREQRLHTAMRRRLESLNGRVEALRLRLLRYHPGARLQQWAQRLDDLERRMRTVMRHRMTESAGQVAALAQRLRTALPWQQLEHYVARLAALQARLGRAIERDLERLWQRLIRASTGLDAVSPLATLQRGYAIARKLPGKEILRDAATLKTGDEVELRLARGRLECRVEKVDEV